MANNKYEQIAVTFDKRLYDKHALSVVETLQASGYQAYFVGGCVRDLLLDTKPKDFDVVTNARPAAILKLFRQARIIGKRFPIVHVSFGRHFIETTTWVTNRDSLWRRMFYATVNGSIEEDAARRDFTVNALYYDPVSELLIDPVGGLDDLDKKILRMIGPVMQRMEEDPVRMLRALRFAGKTGFRLDVELHKNLSQVGQYLHDESDQRIYLEWVKMVLSGASLSSFENIKSSQCLGILLPALQQVFQDPMRRKIGLAMIERALGAIDERLSSNKTVSLVFALSVFFWFPIERLLREKRLKSNEDAVCKALLQIASPIRIPLKIREGISEIYVMQTSMRHRSSEHVMTLMKHPRFRASFDFLMLRASSDARLTELAAWWHDFYVGDDWVKADMLQAQDQYHSENLPRENNVRKGKRKFDPSKRSR